MYTKFLEKAQKIVAAHRAQYQFEYVMFGGGSSGGTTTTTQNTAPWAGQQPYLSQTLASAQNLYNNTSDYPQYYPSSTVAPFNSTENSSINNIGQLGENGDSSINSANSALTNYNDGSMLSAGNPYFQNMASQVASTVTPQIESQFTQGNSMNNPAAAFATSQGMGNAIGGLAYQNYSDQSKNQLAAAQLSPSEFQGQLAGQTAALGAGQTAQQQDQSQLTDNVNRYNYNQNLPFQMLQQYANTVNGNYGSSGSTSSPYYSNSLANGLSLGSGLLGANSLTGSAGGGFGSTLLGSGASGLAGLFGSGSAADAAFLPLF